MTENEEKELLTLTRDNNKMIRDIWTALIEGNPNDDLKDFVMNILANLVANKVGYYGQQFDKTNDSHK